MAVNMCSHIALLKYHIPHRTISETYGLINPMRYQESYLNPIMILKADFRFAPSQWGTVLLCNDTSHWLGTSLESALTLYHIAATGGPCYIGNDPMSYTGQVAVTIAGIECEPWASRSYSGFPEGTASAASNYCRNPGNANSRGPWCIGVDNAVGFCDVLWCSSAGWY